MRKTLLVLFTLLFSIAWVSASGAQPSNWQLIGPEGGDVRSLAYDPGDPSHILLGTSAGQLFVSRDAGNSWTPFVHLGINDDYVLDHIVFDPSNSNIIYVAGWSLFNNDEGDVFRTDDGGQTWQALKGMHGKSVRALTMAPSDHNILVAGAMDGVFRTRDGGQTWEQISPKAKADMTGVTGEPLYSLESVAIDPQNPDIIYAGTWHLPWRTGDGGATWHPMQDGWLMDSDVFSIIIDPKAPSTVWASACSGIYKSVSSGSMFTRMRGIPHSAIRTRVLKQDPKRPSIVYAGTTGGLWKTFDGGAKWELYSAPDVIVNDILIDPNNPERMLLATDRGGVLASNDGFDHYTSSNRGFAHRVVGAVMADRKDPSRLYVGIVNDKNLGGFFYTDDTGKLWKQTSKGLDERDVLSLQQSEDGVIFAGTNHGIFFLTSLKGTWEPAKMISGPLPAVEEKQAAEKPVTGKSSKSKAAAAQQKTAVARKPKPTEEVVIPLARAPRIRGLDIGEHVWFAATDQGLFVSVDHGKKWYGLPVEGERDLLTVHAYQGGLVTLTSVKHAYLSRDEGKTWAEPGTPKYVTNIFNLTMAPENTLWMATREGALSSTDGGATWVHTLGGLSPRDVTSVRYDSTGQRLLATVLNTSAIYESKDGGKTWSKTSDTGVSIRAAMDYQGRLLLASSYNGLVLQQGADTAMVSQTNTAATGDSTSQKQ